MMKQIKLAGVALIGAIAALTGFSETPITLNGGGVYESRLPVMFITTADGQPVTDKENYKAAHLALVGNADFSKEKWLYDGEIQIKGRGNSTWWLPKKPYKIKLAEKANLLNMGKNKHWVLQANYLDECLMRNKVGNDLSAEFGLVSMDSTWVDVVFNGTYVGNYLLCEHIRVGSTRVDIFDWDDVIGDADETNLGFLTDDPTRDITGGYLFELSDEYDEVSKFKTATGLKVMVNTPEYLFTNFRMFSYVRQLWQGLEDAWCSPVKRNSLGISWSEYADVDSMVAFWLTQEILGNSDASYKSRYAYKDVGSPLVFGPVWDFDWDCGSAAVGIYPEGWALSIRKEEACFYKYWLTDAEFRRKALAAYHQVRPYLANLVADDGLLDRYCDYLAVSGAQNTSLWFYERGFANDFSQYKDYLARRFEWLDTQFASEETLERSVSILYGLPEAPVCGLTKAATSNGILYDFGTPIGSVSIKCTKPRKGVSRLTGKVCDIYGKSTSIKVIKVATSLSPSQALVTVSGFGVLSVMVGDDGFLGTLGVYGLAGGSFVGRMNADACRFVLGNLPEALVDYRVVRELLPTGTVVNVRSGWKTPPAAKVRFVSTKSGTEMRLNESRGRTNRAALKLKLTAKTGRLKGSFKLYLANAKGRVFAKTVSVVGLVADGKAVARAYVKIGRDRYEWPVELIPISD